MKKALLYIFSAIFLFTTAAFAADKPASDVKNSTNIVKAAKMHATGKVVSISGNVIRIERTVKGDIEKMEFILEEPAMEIAVGDAVKIEYMEKDGKLIASRIKKKRFLKGD
jgi:hypothetical protein